MWKLAHFCSSTANCSGWQQSSAVMLIRLTTFTGSGLNCPCVGCVHVIGVCVEVCGSGASACHWAGWAVTFLIAWARPRPTWLITVSFFSESSECWLGSGFTGMSSEVTGCHGKAEDSRFVLVGMFLRCSEDSDDSSKKEFSGKRNS